MGCLNGSGHGGLNVSVAAARGRRTLALLADPAAYGRAVLWSVLRHLLRARRDGLPLAVRLRGTDDHPWHRHAVPISEAEAEGIAQRYGVDVAPGVETMAARLAALPELRSYEYSKAPTLGPFGLIAQRGRRRGRHRVVCRRQGDRLRRRHGSPARWLPPGRAGGPAQGRPRALSPHPEVGGSLPDRARHRWRRFRPPVGRPPRGGRDPANEAQPRRRPRGRRIQPRRPRPAPVPGRRLGPADLAGLILAPAAPPCGPCPCP